LSLKDAPSGTVEIRGEVYFPRAAFDRVNREREQAGEPLFANPRNAAAGAMRNLDPRLVARRGLGFWAYQAVGELDLATHADMLARLSAWGLPVEPHWERVAAATRWSSGARAGRTSAARSPSKPMASSSS
jgi:DNA ligase (NAD+)